MKKVLFTLALAAFGLIAGAQDKPAPKLAFGTDASNLITEIELEPGQQSDQIQVILVEQQEVVAMGFQLQWIMKDVNGQPTDKVVCPNAIPDDPDFPMDYAWSVPLGLSTAAAANGGIPGNALAVSNPLFATWRWVGTNTSRNQFWWPRGNFMPPIAVGAMVFQPAADWDEEYATFEFDLNYALYNQTWETTPSSMKAYEARPTDPMVLKIKNKNYQPPVVTVADPVIAFAEENNVLTVTVTAEEGCTLIVNGTAVDSNVYSYTVEHTDIYAQQVVNVTAQAVKGDATSDEVSDSYTFQAQDQPYAETPVIEFVEDASGVMITIDNETSYTINVDGVQVAPRGEAYYYVDKVYDKAQEIVVWAENAPGYPYITTEATETYNLPAKEKQKNSTPSITYTYNDETITVSAYGCTEEGVVYTLIDPNGVAHESPYTFEYDKYQGYDGDWTATAVSPTTTVSDECDPYNVHVTAQDQPLPDTPEPVITVGEPNLEEGTVTITVTGQGTVTATVTDGAGTTPYTDEDGDGKIEIVIPCGANENMVNVHATAQLPDHNASEASENYIYIPAKTAKPVITSEEVEGGVNVTVNGNGTLNILIEGYGDGDVITYTGEGPKTFFLASMTDDQEVTVSANAQEEGKAVSDYAIEDIIVPAKPVTPTTQCAKPDGGYVNGQDFHGVTVTLTNNETAEGTQLHYTVTKDGVVITEDAIYEGPFNLTEDGDYNIDFWATAPNMLDSTHGGLIFTIDETTGLSELLEGKNVVSVRYFNMAGQEMQEANGMTIVVTTYTDGTSSAVKVLK